jgi:hypothetical protein
MLEIRISQSILRRDNVEAPHECRRSLVPLYVPVHGVGEVGQRCRYMHLTKPKKLDNSVTEFNNYYVSTNSYKCYNRNLKPIF